MADISLEKARNLVRENYLQDENVTLDNLKDLAGLTREERIKIAQRGADLVSQVRTTTKPSLMEAFLAEYGLSTKEGLALMCLAEALLRVPDSKTIDRLIEDKILGGDWKNHAGHSISALVNVSTMGLQVTNAVLKEGEEGVASTLQAMVKRLGMPVIRRAVKQVMKELGSQFVLGETIEKARVRAEFFEEKGFTYSYDMLGEAAHTAKDAKKYFKAYKNAIENLSQAAKSDVRNNPGISIKLSALHPRYEMPNRERVLKELVPRVLELAEAAKAANMGFNIDAEEADRLDLSLDIIEEVLASPTLKGWEGFGVVVQAYGRRAPFVIDWLYNLAEGLDRKIMVRLVKGAYWDAEIKRAQILGLDSFPVFTQKAYSDISYIACTKKLFAMRDRIYPQFATHNAHTVAAVQHYGKGAEPDSFEFQRLHGMGESLHEVMMREKSTRCRIYAPVGIHKDLLAYLVRRLLENGANSSFVNQIVDSAIPPADVAADPFEGAKSLKPPFIKNPEDIFGKDRVNSKGWDITDSLELEKIEQKRNPFKTKYWDHTSSLKGALHKVYNPANPGDEVGCLKLASIGDCEEAFDRSGKAFAGWAETSIENRAACLEKAANLLEENTFEFFGLLAREAGKSIPDAISEVREAVDFLRYYAKETRNLEGEGRTPRGVFVCISPWNFPLAIFLGQISAALVSGNVVIAKPAEQTPLVASFATQLLHQAGIPQNVLQLLPGEGATIGAKLTSHPKVAGVCFTGSTETAQMINKSMADNTSPEAPLIAETGGLNAMIVDSTALPEQAITDIVASSFQSAGQRCSALRMLYIQEDIKDTFLRMLYGAMEELKVGNPWDLNTDVGPVIDEEALQTIEKYSQKLEKAGKLLKKLDVPKGGLFVAPALFEVGGIEDLDREIFGPILHVATYKAGTLDKVIETINQKGFGLTMGLHTRIDDRVGKVQSSAHVGNLYVNRNQIGAVVGCQPFGGEGLSGTGPKAGGPHYLDVFSLQDNLVNKAPQPISNDLGVKALQKVIKGFASQQADVEKIRAGLRTNLATLFPSNLDLIEKYITKLEKIPDREFMPSPVGESNELVKVPKGVVMCAGTGGQTLLLHILQALYFGNKVVAFSDSIHFDNKDFESFPVIFLNKIVFPQEIGFVDGINLIGFYGQIEKMRAVRKSLANKDGPIIPLVTESYAPYRFYHERHCCIDTTASGGDAQLLGGG